MKPLQRTALLLLAATGLSGCVALAVPVLAGGAGARHLLHGHHAPPDQPAGGELASTAASPAPAAPAPTQAASHLAYPPVPDATAVVAAKPVAGPAPSPPPAIEPLPADLRQARAGQVYRGNVPPPGGAAATVAAAVAAPSVAGPVPKSPAVADWPSLGRYVTGHLSDASAMLLARGGPPASPAPSCGGLPLAVLAPATLVEAAARNAADRSWLDALHTLNVTLVLTGTSPTAGAALAKAGSPAPIPGDTLFVPTAPADMPAIRAKVAARYCVLAVAGRDAADFPNGYLPGTTPAAYRDRWGAGWFLFSPR